VYAAVAAIVQNDVQQTSAVCEVLGVSRSAYYAWSTREASAHEDRDAELSALVRDIFWKHRRRYGARRIVAQLAEQGESCGTRRVAKLLENQGLSAIQPKSFVPKTTDSRHTLGYSPNLLLDMPELTAINQLLVGDITSVPLADGTFCDLATLMDRFSRRIVGWNLADFMTEELVIPVLQVAIRERQPAAGLIHHTDRGGQFASTRYRAILRRAGILQSMRRAGNCYDNAFMESAYGTFKTELEMTEYQQQRAARREIGDYIAYYNLERKHSALGYLSPHQFELLQASEI